MDAKESDEGLKNWAELRFSIIGGLLARPPGKGELGQELESLAKHQYRHPTKKTMVKFGTSTIERWYYQALRSSDPIEALSRKIRSDSGGTTAMNSQMMNILEKQYKQFPNWSYKLHSDNLTVAVNNKKIGDTPSYSTVVRRMKERGWCKKRSSKTPGQKKAAERLERSEVRSYESEYVHALWHLDFHEGRRMADVNGKWYTPKALCILDDNSRLCCHIQWYLDETTDALIHGLTQAFHKRGLPRSLMTDNGSAMLAGETEKGLLRLGIKHDKTLPYSPYQNGKQEAFWGQLEGRLLAMLSRVDPLTLEFLNRASQAWIEQEYNRTLHEEIRTSPMERLLKGQNVSRPSPGSEEMRFAFTIPDKRIQRKSDGTIQLMGIRFEIPSRFRHFRKINVRYQSWDLSMAYMIDEKTNDILAKIYPQDKTKNAHGHRRTLDALPETASTDTDSDPIPPLMHKILADYAATGLPPAYIPKEEKEPPTDNVTKIKKEKKKNE